MSDTRGGMVKFTILTRHYISDGVYDLVAGVETWLPQSSFRLEPDTHHQSNAAALGPNTDLAFVRVIPLAGGNPIECKESLANTLAGQETALGQARVYTEVAP